MMIKFVDICWAHESNDPQPSLPSFGLNDYRIMPGDCCLIVDETRDYIHFLSGNKVLCLNRNDNGEKYEYCP